VSATFSQTTLTLDRDRGRGDSALKAILLVLLVGWTHWFATAEITVHEVADGGRIEVDQMAHAIDSLVAGRVVASRIVLGAQVAAGDVLVEIDSDAERRRLEEEETRLTTIQPELDALARELASIEQTVASDRQATLSAVEQARARHEDAKLAAAQAEEEAHRADQLSRQGAIPDLERMRARTEADRRRAASDALNLERGHLEATQRTRDMQQVTRAEELRVSIASLEGAKLRSRSAIAVLRGDIDKRTIRAAVSGRIGEALGVRAGEYVKEGARLGAIIPPGSLRAVADFWPQAALGRVRPGQTARLRLEGFPWMQYGTVAATVTSVGTEVHDGKVRVELEVRPDPASRIPLEHGLPGTVEVDVERASPARLAFRAAGRTLGRPVSEKRL
jgi:membrane fusion protein (multidrug efflux system)